MKRVSTRVLSIFCVLVLLLLSSVTSFAAYDYPLLDLVFTSAETLYEETDGWSSNKLVGTVTVDIQESATDLKMHSFSGCDNLTSVYINVEDPASNLKMYGASYCDSLTSVTIKSTGNVTIKAGAFKGCLALEEVIFDVEGTLTIETSSFEGCTKLNEVDFSNIGSLILYGEYCFLGSGLKEVNLLSNFSYDCDEEDRESADYGFFFSGCENLEKFTADIEEIPVGLFWASDNLKSAYLTQKVEKIEWLGFGVCRDPSTSANKYLPLEDLVVYGYTNSATEEYCDEYGIKFIPVDSAEFNTITSSQSSTATIGTPTSVTLSVAGFPETIKLENPLGSELTFAREDAEIVTNESGEEWTVNLTPMSEADTYTVTSDYGLADLCSTDEITVYAKEDTRPPVISVETVTPAPIGETAQISVTVKGSPEAIRFVDENTKTISREKAQIVENDDNSETWTVNLLVNSDEQQFTVYAKEETGWSEQGTDFTLKAKVIVYSTEIKDFAFEESLDGVIYNGVNKITLTTANGVSKVQFMKDGNTWTYTENNSEVIEIDGQKYWTIRMNFCTLGDNTFDIRVRSPKTTFEFADALNVTVYSR
ncbi:MAG: leucine-rich repeat protein [Clostridia bacterium]|nr:leucine-rich repeat protein [Clostridia bacterium]